ncbi:MAG: acetylornithine aminotransferase [Pirellulaceae bacterium]|nr:MAG: acetylornithine aminotransferase [Pirellulaceae bacterium]
MLRPLADEPVPHLVTELPGPQARQLIAEDERYLSPSYTRVYPLAVARGSGVVIEDVDGNRFLDFTAGIAVCSTGHCHPRVVQAIQRQAEQLLHMSGTDFYYAPQKDLARRLALAAPGKDPKRVFFTNSGAEAIEAAFKLARFHTGRKQIIAFRGAFHGRTLGALSLTASKVVQRRRFAPLVPNVSHIDFPYCFRCPRRAADGCCGQPLEQLQQLFRQIVAPDEVAAVFVEPIQGEGGYIVPPADFHRRLRQITQEHGILLVADEVQTGMGRTGRLFAMEHFGVEPDIICLAKGIASGMPLGAMIARADIMTWPRGSHASTFGGNPVSCAAALATLDLLEEGLVDHAARMGRLLLDALNRLARRYPIIGDVRGLGLMIGMELVHPSGPQAGQPFPEAAQRVLDGCFRRGLLLLTCGESTVRFCPPLVVQQRHIEAAIQILDEVIAQIDREAAALATGKGTP